MANTADQLSEQIDSLLERYLQLLNQYTALRASLTTAQSAIHQSIARANFSADRGIRYGQDFYDSRMQATRLCCVTLAPDATPNVAIGGGAGRRGRNESYATSSEDGDEASSKVGELQSEYGVTSDFEEQKRKPALSEKHEEMKKVPHAGRDDAGLNLEKLRLEEEDDNRHETAKKDAPAEREIPNGLYHTDGQNDEHDPGSDSKQEKDSRRGVSTSDSQAEWNTNHASNHTNNHTARSGSTDDSKRNNNTPQSRDPILMFGLFVPPSLRTAQKEAINMLENIIPQLINIDAEMKTTEISIRRARKHRAKAEGEVEKTTKLDREKQAGEKEQQSH